MLGGTFVNRPTWPALVCSNLVSCSWAGDVDMVESSGRFPEQPRRSKYGVAHMYTRSYPGSSFILPISDCRRFYKFPDVEDHRVDVRMGPKANGSRAN